MLWFRENNITCCGFGFRAHKTYACFGFVLFCFAVFPQGSPSGVSKGAIVGIVLGSVAAAVTITAIIALIIMRKRMKGYAAISRRKRCKHFFFHLCSRVDSYSSTCSFQGFFEDRRSKELHIC